MIFTDIESASTRETAAPGRRRLAALVAVLVVAGLLVVLVAMQRGRLYGRIVDEDGGPLGIRGSTTTRVPSAVGQPITWGIASLSNGTGSDAVIGDVRLVPEPSGGFEVLGIQLASTEAPGGAVFGFPPADVAPYLEPFEGAVIKPGQENDRMIFVGIRLNRPGLASFDRIDVDYEVGGKRYTGQFHDSLVVCTLEVEVCDRSYEKEPGEE